MTEEEKNKIMNEKIKETFEILMKTTPLGKEEAMKNELLLKVLKSKMKISILNSLDYEAIEKISKNENFRLFNDIDSSELEDMIANREDKEKILKNEEILKGMRNR